MNILAGIVKMKAVAVLLGPAGVGLIGFYQSLMLTASAVSSLGMVNSGTRRIAERVDGNASDVDVTRRALFWGSLVQALVGGLIFYMASPLITHYAVNAPERSDEVAWLAIGVVVIVGTGAQTAVLTGLRRVGDIACIQVISGLIGGAVGIFALWVWGDGGLLVLVLITPLVTFGLGHFFVLRLERPMNRSPSREVIREWSCITWLGLAIMISALVTFAGHLLVRVLVQRELGAAALGQFQAAWTIGITYLTFILGAMATDYYPRLSKVISDKVAASRLVNQQTEVAILLCGPVLVGMVGFAPVVIRLLYTADFVPAVEILQLQLIGDVLKVISMPLSFVLLAVGAGKAYVVTETIGIAVFVTGVTLGLPLFGINVTGIAFIALYATYLPLVLWQSSLRINFMWTPTVIGQAVLLIVTILFVYFTSRVSDFWGLVASLVLGAVFAICSLVRLSVATEATGKLAPLVKLGKRIRNIVLKSK
jgi:O-antigen/teichoic acid export membrane protein